MNPTAITYCFTFTDNKKEIFNLQFHPRTLEVTLSSPSDLASLPHWANLSFCQCPHCPLSADLNRYCPLAAKIASLVNRFNTIVSHDDVEVEIITSDRRFYLRTTAQRAICSMMGLIIASSGCPHTVYFKPMARFHLPAATEEETLYRTTSAYMLAQYFIMQKGGKPDSQLTKLTQIYKNIQIVNSSIVGRIRAGSSTDSSINSLILLDIFAKSMPVAIEESLEEIKYLFEPFLKDI